MRHMDHGDEARSTNKGMRFLPIIPLVLILVVVLHIFAAVFLAKTGSDTFSFSNPLTYGMVGLLLVFAVTKLKHIWGFMRRKDKK